MKMSTERKRQILFSYNYENSSDFMNSLKRFRDGPIDVCGLSFENHHPNLRCLLCRSCNFNSQSSLSLQLHHFVLVCWWLVYQLYHMLSLMNNWSKAIVSSDFLVLSKCWNGLSYFAEISRVKDDEHVYHLPVVCSWWYSVSDAESMMMGLWGQWEGWGKPIVWLHYVQYPTYISAAKPQQFH